MQNKYHVTMLSAEPTPGFTTAHFETVLANSEEEAEENALFALYCKNKSEAQRVKRTSVLPVAQ